MTDSSSQYLIDDLEKRIHKLQYFVEYQCIQQKMWVASGRQWLPILHRIKSEIAAARDTGHPPAEPIPPQEPKSRRSTGMGRRGSRRRGDVRAAHGEG